MFSKTYSLGKSHRILRNNYSLYKQKGKKLSKPLLEEFENLLQELDKACLEKNREKASDLAKRVDKFSSEHLKKSIFDFTKELVFALLFALALATLIRQSWFEIYEIPTGSMRPTFKEKDDVTASKTAFGINVPLKTEHFYFDPDLIQRTGIVIFSGDGVDLPDTDTKYFGIFPYKKRYTKRLIGKPGDSIYFYGGKLYGVDKEGNKIAELLDSPWMQKLDHIPFIQFEGKIASNKTSEIYFLHMNIPMARLTSNMGKGIKGEVFDGQKWVQDTPKKEKHESIESYFDIFGLGNYAMARLVSKDELPKNEETSKLQDAPLYLELNHHPSLTFPRLNLQGRDAEYGVLLNPEKSFIPLNQEQLKRILENMYTARFVIKDGFAKRYSEEDSSFRDTSPRFPNVPDGTYEFYYGIAYKIGMGAIASKLGKESPLYDESAQNIQKLFNLGINFNREFEPKRAGPRLFPHRYAYFRDGDLYLMGAPIIKKEDKNLQDFLAKEESKSKSSSSSRPYIPFVDAGAPIKEGGKLDVEFIRRFGVTVPENKYLLLGDNHAMSSDSRFFGFVHENNLQGVPSVLIWPTGERWGFPPQKPYNFFSLPRLIIWGIAALIGLLFYLWHRSRLNKPYFKKINFK